MKRMIIALAGAFMLAGVATGDVAMAQAAKTPPPKPVTDFKAVQEHLYGLNYAVGERNGQLTPELKSAITLWRKNRRSTASGDMTTAEEAQLLAIPLSKTWAAVAYTPAGATSVVFGKPSRDAAEAEVKAACEKDNKRCSIVTTSGSTCIAVSTYSGVVDGNPAMGTWGSYRPTVAAANEAALAVCKKNAPQPATCAVRETVCADGSHKK